MSEETTAVPQHWEAPGGKWYFLVDPAWRETEEAPDPPPEAVIGGWIIDEDGEADFFQPNSHYVPSVPGLPTDPVDAALQLVSSGEGESSQLLEQLLQVVLGVAVDEQDAVVVAPAPDERLSVLVATAPAHRAGIEVPGWAEVTVRELAEVLPDEGLDVLLNPASPASMRVHGGALKQWLGGGFAAPEADDSGAARD